MRFIRMSGAQNTFWFASELNSQLSKSKKRKAAQRLCNSYYGLKTDGLIFLKTKRGFDFGWDFFNSDGSDAEMCGNAARCATRFYFRKIKAKKKITFSTVAGEITGEVYRNGQVNVLMTEISQVKKMTVLGVSGIFVNTGVPHFVIERKPDAKLALRLRKVKSFGVAGANITFVGRLKKNKLEAVTYERGVENFTRACGTGAVAAAMYLQFRKGPQKKIQVQMPGGILVIENARAGVRPNLIGDAKFEIEVLELGELK
jgi:diaminopimelate epimerase